MSMYGDGFDEGGTLNHDPEGKSYQERARERSNRGRGGSGCFPHDALVETRSGKVKIANLTVGQTVLSFRDGALAERRITRVLVRPPTAITRVEFDIGPALSATPDHCFLTNKGWQSLGSLKPGSFVMRTTWGYMRVQRVLTAKTYLPVYNLRTACERNFIVDGYAAHNYSHFCALRSAFHVFMFEGLSKSKLSLT